jgi:hypothetical protein
MTTDFSDSNKSQSFSRYTDADRITEITGIAKDNFPKLRQFAGRVGPFPGLYTMITDNFSPIRIGPGNCKKSVGPPTPTSIYIDQGLDGRFYRQRHRIRNIVP